MSSPKIPSTSHKDHEFNAQTSEIKNISFDPVKATHLLECQNYQHTHERKLLQDEDLFCPITCAYLPSSRDVCIVGRGPYIQSYPLFSKKEIDAASTNYGFKYKMFQHDEGSIHGMRFLNDNTNTLEWTNGDDYDLGLVFGGRYFTLFQTNYTNHIQPISFTQQTNNAQANATKNIKATTIIQCSDWIWDSTIIIKQNNDYQHETSSLNKNSNIMMSPTLIIAVAFMNNTCELWRFSKDCNTNYDIVFCPQRLHKISCEVRCMTYSMTFFHWKNFHLQNTRNWNKEPSHIESITNHERISYSLMVASGTVFNEILIWKIYSNEKYLNCNDVITDDTPTADNQPSLNARVIHRLKGHEGVIFKVKFFETNMGDHYIVSTSDDRTVRLWKLISNNSSYEQESYIPYWVGWGHTARVWDATFTSHGILTSGEDGTARLWDINTGNQLVELKGHACQSIWGAVVDKSGEVAATFGNDGCVKIWDLSVQQILNSVTSVDDMKEKINEHESYIDDDNINERKRLGLARKLLPWDDDIFAELYKIANSHNKISDILNILKVQEEPNAEIDETVQTSKKKNKRSKKPKIKKQIIAGMSFYPNMEVGREKVLFATRAGNLFSIYLNSSKCEIHFPWFNEQANLSNSTSIPTASCIAIHPNENLVAIGTTGKSIILCNIVTLIEYGGKTFPLNVSSPSNIIFESPLSHYSIQNLLWLNKKQLIASYIKGKVIVWNFSSCPDSTSKNGIDPPKALMVLDMGSSNGVPMSFAHDKNHHRLIVGDSRGNLALFNLDVPSTADYNTKDHVIERTPIYKVDKAHGKEHITSIVHDHRNNLILSVGNDGILHELAIPKNVDKIANGFIRHKRICMPVSFLTALTHIWLVPHHNKQQSVIVGGYFGHKFIIFDVTRKYLILQIETGGRQRIHDFVINLQNSGFHFPRYHAFVFCIARKDGRNEMHLHQFNTDEIQQRNHLKCSITTIQNKDKCSYDKNSFHYSIGNSFHGETVNSACWCTSLIPGRAILLSGSNDCTVRLSIYQNGSLHCIKDLPPHESCVRAVASSKHKGSKSSLLLTCGGKLSMNFYLLIDTEVSKRHCDVENDLNLSVYFLCNNRHLLPRRSTAIDQRINAVKMIPLASCPDMHLVFSGDSDGSFQLIIISDDITQTSPILFRHIFTSNARPILSLDVLDLDGVILVCLGNSAGDILIWEIPDLSIYSKNKNLENDVEFPSSPLFIYKAHQMGTNGISSIIASSNLTSNLVEIVVCSGGDDQALTTAILSYSRDEFGRYQGLITMIQCERLNEANSSAIKSVKLMKNQGDGFRLYSVGYDQRLALWKVHCRSPERNGNEMMSLLSSSFVHVSDISTLDCIVVKEAYGLEKELCVVVGEGASLFSLDRGIASAAEVLTKANFLLITAGAGASSDSGLATYDSMPQKYRDMCTPFQFVEDCASFQEYWLKFAKLYLETKPHDGYDILDEWCTGGQLKQLNRPDHNQFQKSDLTVVEASPWWIYTSNVDGHFRRFTSFSDCVCEIHGNASEFRCSSAIGFTNGCEREGDIWRNWNKNVNMLKTNECINTVMYADDYDDSLLKCQFCNLPARPSVLMFHDTDEYILQQIEKERQRYQSWEERVENEVSLKGQRLVILEIGCGVMVPVVRQEGEEVLHDIISKLESKDNTIKPTQEQNRVTFIRINPKNAEINFVEKSFSAISIYNSSLQSLQLINKWIKSINKTNQD